MEAENLQLEDFVSTKDGVEITHNRAKQRSDCLVSKFLVPRTELEPNYAAICEEYLTAVRNILGQNKGRVWYTGINTIIQYYISYYQIV